MNFYGNKLFTLGVVEEEVLEEEWMEVEGVVE